MTPEERPQCNCGNDLQTGGGMCHACHDSAVMDIQKALARAIAAYQADEEKAIKMLEDLHVKIEAMRVALEKI